MNILGKKIRKMLSSNNLILIVCLSSLIHRVQKSNCVATKYLVRDSSSCSGVSVTDDELFSSIRTKR